jgi:hypothetical protein
VDGAATLYRGSMNCGPGEPPGPGGTFAMAAMPECGDWLGYMPGLRGGPGGEGGVWLRFLRMRRKTPRAIRARRARAIVS